MKGPRGLKRTAAGLLALLPLACGGGPGALPASASSPQVAATSTPTPTPDPGPPNVVLIVADDLGWGDLGSYGHPVIRTPNLDRLAAEGARFTSFYVPTPICAPSRAGLLTGRFPPRVGVSWNPSKGLRDGEVVIASVLSARGYATGMVGKWHLGWEREEMPVHYGFDFYYGIPAGEDESDFVLGDTLTTDRVSPERLAQRYTDEAVKFITAQGRDRRFFMYIAHRDPHLPNYASPEFAGRSAAGAYGDVIEQLDASVGTLMEALGALGVDQTTLVVLMSDNGPVVPPLGPGSAGPFSGGKASCEEGGVRVPAIMRWPARIRPGRVVSEPVSSLDLFPTLVTLTGATLPAKHYDGQDISRLVTGEVDRIGGPGIDNGREIIFFGQSGAAGLRSGKWKYLRPGLWSGSISLFDLEADPGERHDLSRDHPELVMQLEERLVELVP